jgi:monoamine oxidase
VILPLAPLGAMHGEAAGAALRERGGVVRTGERVTALEEGAVVLADGGRLEADLVVVALPPAESAALLGDPDPALEDSPIVSAHLLFDRPILGFEVAALLGSPAHWMFDRGALTGHLPEQGQYLTVVSSGAPELLDVRGKALVDLLAGEVTARLGSATLLWSRVSREPAATFAALPGTASRRPGPETGRPGVARAGAWTDTGWPATMESAVRSGRAAARSLLASSPGPAPA